MENFAQYGIAVFTVGGLFWLLNKGIDTWCKARPAVSASLPQDCDKLIIALENNTKAMEGVTELVNIMRIAQAEQSAMLKELVDKARR